MKKKLLPGSTIGVLGSGQLGRMLAMAARTIGYHIHIYSPEKNSPAGQIADVAYASPYDDLAAVQHFARSVDVVTLEFENIPITVLEAIEGIVPIRPGPQVLYTAQNRLREKTFLKQNGFPLAPFYHVRHLDDLHQGLAQIGTPAVLKTAGFGYDGKGQSKIMSPEDAKPALEKLGYQEAVLEAFVDFEKEISVVAARGLDGSFAHYGVIENRHSNHILDVSFAPGNVSPGVSQQAVEIIRELMERLDVVGLLCVEFFLTRDGRLLINEMAPRPHNTGHLTIDAAPVSQFEQQLRAICGLPLGDTRILYPAAMANLLGDLWEDGEPNWEAVLKLPRVKLHLYGKAEARPGRKMGHLTALASTTKEAVATVTQAREKLKIREGILR